VVARGGEFSFGSILCSFMFDRVILLRLEVVLDPSTA
jgi:hypothetical protein